MDSKKEVKMKLKSKWRQNKELILLIIGAAILGVIIAGANSWHYNQQVNIYHLEESQTISSDEIAEFSFELEEPQTIDELAIDMEIEDIEANTVITMELNEEEIEEITDSSPTVNPPIDILEEENTVTLERTSVGFTDQQLTNVNITGFDSFRQMIFILLNFFALLLVFSPVGYIKYTDFLNKKKMEEEFPSFLRDVVQGTRAGMSLPQAIQNTEAANYNALGDEIEKMSAQLEWGVPFDKVLSSFAKRTKSSLIKRSTDTVIQAYKSGGNIQDVLESVGDNIRSIKKLEEERQSQLYGEMITGYAVYFIFIGILIALTTYLLPSLAEATEAFEGGLDILGSDGGGDLEENIELYEVWFQRLVFIQAIFSGLIVGKLSEGSLKAGIKHSAILFAVGYLAVTFFL